MAEDALVATRVIFTPSGRQGEVARGTNVLEAGMPVAFDVLCNEIKGLGLNISLEKKQLEGVGLL